MHFVIIIADHAEDAIDECLDRYEKILDWRFPEIMNDDEDEPKQHPEERENS